MGVGELMGGLPEQEPYSPPLAIARAIDEPVAV